MSDEKILKDAQYRKGLSIAFFNATNSAIEMVKLEADQKWKESLNFAHLDGDKPKGKAKPKKQKSLIPGFQERFIFYRDWLLEEHKTYYATTIANVGVVYNQIETLEKIKGTTNRDELKEVWISLSEDERHDPEIKRVVAELKKQYEKA